MEPVIPQSLNYASLKPEAVEHEIKLVRFTPQTNIQNQIPNDVVRFLLQGNGFFDPYSAYIRMRVDLDPDNVITNSADGLIDKSYKGGDVYTLTASNDLTTDENFVVPQEGGNYYSNTPVKVPWIGPGGLVQQRSVNQRDLAGTTQGDTLAKVQPHAQFKILDRSAHSFINRMVIRSQGTEIERIEQYDIMAAMINDMIYSNEQAQLHAYEGFACKRYQRQDEPVGDDTLNELVSFLDCHKDRDRVGEVSYGYAVTPVQSAHDAPQRGVICEGNSATDSSFIYTSDGAQKWWSTKKQQALASNLPFPEYHASKFQNLTYFNQDSNSYIPANPANVSFKDPFNRQSFTYEGEYKGTKIFNDNVSDFIKVGSDYDARFSRQPQMLNNNEASTDQIANSSELYGKHKYTNADFYRLKTNNTWLDNHFLDSNTNNNSIAKDRFELAGQSVQVTKYGNRYVEFVIPIYSGLIGVMQPDKRLIPLSLMPLEVDFTLNPHALICAYTQLGKNQDLNRNYKMLNFDMFAHMIFFEQNIHRSLESITAEHGLFMHMNSFYMAPVTMNSNKAITTTVPVNLHFKSINSLHTVFMYQNYLTDTTSRKLHFCSHGIKRMQLRNGVEFIPSEPLERLTTDMQYTTGNGNRFFIEMMKAWNKLHDPATDAALDAGYAFHIDTPAYGTYEHLVDPTQQALGTFSIKHKDDNDLSDTYTSIVDNSYHKTTRISVFGFDKGISTITSGANFIASNPALEVTIPVYTKQAIYKNMRDFSSRVGRCAYSLSLEGIALGAEKNLMTGRKGMTPFDLQLDGAKQEQDPSLTITFARADFVVYVRPDLVVAVLGK